MELVLLVYDDSKLLLHKMVPICSTTASVDFDCREYMFSGIDIPVNHSIF